MNDIQKLQNIIDTSSNIVFFGGAGVSTESGIPDFRSTDGLYTQEWKYPPEHIISRSFFNANPQEFYRFYCEKMIFPNAKPNPAHLKLAELEQKHKLSAVITQNIDGLHQMAGSKNVIELHGSIHRNYCTRCGTFYDTAFIIANQPLPLCTKSIQDIPGLTTGQCNHLIKPDVTLYEESLNPDVTQRCIQAISKADSLIIGGTSLIVYPAASFINYFRGNNLILINKTPTQADKNATLVIHDEIGKIFSKITV